MAQRIANARDRQQTADRHPRFTRIHRSTIVNVERVTAVERGADRTYTVHVEGRTDPLSMSRRRAGTLKGRLA